MALERNDIEQILSEIWEDLLDVDVEPDDDFFELGGYSLLIVNVVTEARKRGLEMAANDIYTHKTPSAIASALGGSGTAANAVPAGADPDFSTVWETGLSPMRTAPSPPWSRWPPKAPAPRSSASTGVPATSGSWPTLSTASVVNARRTGWRWPACGVASGPRSPSWRWPRAI